MILFLLLIQLSQPFHWHNEDSLIVTQWTIRDGLPVNSTNRIIQDSDGFIWISTYDGMVRFDGIAFETLNTSNTPSILNNRIAYFHKTPDQTIWVALENLGMLRYRNQEFRLFDDRDGLTLERISQIKTDPDGHPLVGANDGLYRFDPVQERFNRIDLVADGTNYHVYDMLTDDGIIWIATYDGFYAYRDTIPTRFSSGLFVGLVEDKNGVIWVGGFSGLYRIDRGMEPKKVNSDAIRSMYSIGDRILYTSDKGLNVVDGGQRRSVQGVGIDKGADLMFTFVDSYGLNWFITVDGIVFVLEGMQAKRAVSLDRITKASALSIYEDSERNLWFASRRGGLFRVKRNPMQHIGVPEGLVGDNILGLFFDNRNRLFVGVRDAGFSVVDDYRIRNYPQKALNENAIIQTFGQDTDGRIWIGTYQNGLISFGNDGLDLKQVQIGKTLMTNDVRAIHTAKNGVVWLATSGGLVQFNPDTQEYNILDRSTGLPSQLLRNIIEDEKGRLWIATGDNGAFRYDPATNDILILNSSNGMPSNLIRSILIDPDDPSVIWFGSETSGLIRYSNGEFNFASTDAGLPDHIVHSIQIGPFGWIWISTNKGIVRILKSDLNEYLDGESAGFHMVVHDMDAGMRNSEANGGFGSGSLISPDGESILVSTQSGVAILPIMEYDRTDPAPPVYIRSGNRYTQQGEIVLVDGEDDIRIEFTALRYASPGRVRLQYRLIGLDDEWKQVFSDRSVHYQNLEPGEYVFEVISWNEAGTIASEPARMRISVQEVYHQTLWFRLLILLSLIAIIWLVTTIRLRNLKTIQQRLETLVDQKTKELRNEKSEVEKQKQMIEEQKAHLQELNDTKDRFFAIIGHDLRGPFQTLLGLSQLMIEEYDEMDDVEIRQNLKHLRASSENLHRLVENLLEWSSLQKGKDRILMEPIDLDDIAKSTVRLFGPIASTKAIHFEAIVPNDMVVMADRNIVETVIRNLVSNAIKFTKSEGIVVLEAGLNETDWWIQVSDNGIGMSESLRKQVMNIDKSVKRRGTMNEWGTGLGLALCKELISLHDGSILVESEPEIGSRFTVRFPIRS